MNLADMILAIAKHEWPDVDWQGFERCATGVGPRGEWEVFSPILYFDDLIPLVIKYGKTHGLYLQNVPLVDYWRALWRGERLQNKNGFEMILSVGSTYNEAAIKAIYTIIEEWL